MDIKKIKDILELVKGTDVTNITITENESTISISREILNSSKIKSQTSTIKDFSITNPDIEESSKENSQENFEDLHIITSPIIGTFYTAPNPQSKNFVHENKKINKKDTLCIIEAMKVMNHIESEVSGTIKEIFVKNGSPVEYGQKLFSIRLKKK